MNLGEVIKHDRTRKGISARQLSLMCGLSPSYISKIETGMDPSLSAFAKIANKLEWSDREIVFLVRLIYG